MDQPQQGGGQGVLLTLFDNLWFQLSVLTTTAAAATTTTSHPGEEQREEEPPSSNNSPPPVASSNIATEGPKAEENDHHQYHQDHQRQSPERKLCTIISGKEALWGEDQSHDEGGDLAATTIPQPSDKKQRKTSKKKSKSMSELEFEELKGFMDMGFSFSEEEADPRLVSIVPGLQRLRNNPGTVDDTAAATVFRPYLSEAWEHRERVDLENAIRRWKLPAPGRGGDLKNHLRCWAHTVASSVR